MTPQAINDLTWFNQTLANTKLIDQLNQIKLIILDVDGTLTDAGVYVDTDREGGRTFSTQDGFLFKYCAQAGITIALMSGKSNTSTRIRGAELGIPEELCLMGIKEKLPVIRQLQATYQITDLATLMVGDDILDTAVKLAAPAITYACPANAPFYVQSTADLILPRTGGDSAIRLLFDLMLFARNQHPVQDLIANVVKQDPYLKKQPCTTTSLTGSLFS